MAEPWREFEKLIARIETTLAPLGAVVKSPDRVEDLVTGKSRDVDVSIRYQIDNVAVLITVECRKRGRVQDDTWIEQLVTKKQKIGAARTIAVSSSGLSDSALKTARHFGIDVRKIAEITEEEIRNWLIISEIVHTTDYTELVSFRYTFHSGAPVGIHPDVANALRANASGALIFTLPDTGEKVCLQEVIDQLRLQGNDLHKGVPLNGTVVTNEMGVTRLPL